MSDRDLSTPVHRVFGDVDPGTRCRVCDRPVDDGRMKYCSAYCRNLTRAVMALLNWGSVRRLVLDRDDRTCQVCGFKQAWLDRGYEHLRAMAEQRIPERPEVVSAVDIPDLPDDEVTEYVDEHREWKDERDAIVEEVFNEASTVGFPVPPDRLEVDHITPIANGGHPFDPGNLQTLCEDCHQDKSAGESYTPGRGDLSQSLFEYADGESLRLPDGGEP